MSRPCSVCADRRRADVDQALTSGEPIRHVAARFQVPASNLFRHSKHMTAAAAEALTDRAHALDIIQQIRAMNSVALQVLHDARAVRDGRLQLAAAAAVLRQLEFSHSLDVEAQQAELWRRVEALEQLAARSNGKDQWSPSGIV